MLALPETERAGREPNPIWLAFYREARRLAELARQRRREAEATAGNAPERPDDRDDTNEWLQPLGGGRSQN